MLLAATAINTDEWVWSLAERNLPTPDSKSIHRYQIMIVRRGDRLAEWRQDMGLASNFRRGEFRVQSFWYETVGQVRDIADYLRNQDEDWRDKIIAADIVDEYKIQQEMRKLQARGLSTFGPGGVLIR